MEPTPQPANRPPDPDCPYSAGAGEVRGRTDDVVFEFGCGCVGGSEEAVRWLLGKTDLREAQEI